MLFNVESWRQVGADAGEAGGCYYFGKKRKEALKNDKKNKILGILDV